MGSERLSSTEAQVCVLNSKTEHFKKVVVDTFAEHSIPGLFRLRFQILDHFVEGIPRFGTNTGLDPPPFEHYHVLIQKLYRRTSRGLKKEQRRPYEPSMMWWR